MNVMTFTNSLRTCEIPYQCHNHVCIPVRSPFSSSSRVSLLDISNLATWDGHHTDLAGRTARKAPGGHVNDDLMNDGLIWFNMVKCGKVMV